MNATLIRNPSEKVQTLGELKLFNSENSDKEIFKCYTLELPWKDNLKKISCIPDGSYKVKYRTANESSKFKYPHFILLNTSPREGILIHAGNYYTQIEGCILVGSGLADINGDGYLDVTNSRETLKKLVELAPDGFELTIKWRENNEEHN